MTDEPIEALIRRGRRRPLELPPGAQAVSWDRAAVMRLVPHRDPFLFVDAVTLIDTAAGAIAGRLALDPSSKVYEGHFPGDPIFPGVLQVEAIGQLGLCLLAARDQAQGGTPAPARVRALRIHHASFLLPLRPPATVEIRARVLADDGLTATCAGQLLDESGAVACFAVLEVHLADR